jgi:hypothetical protein
MPSGSHPRLDHARLERAIYGRQGLHELIGEGPPLLSTYRVVDYVGNHGIDPARDARDLIHASAAKFFEDQGAHIETHPGTSHGFDFSLAVFATFLVVECRPLTPDVEFLVLAPTSADDESEPAPYRGLMRSQNTDELRVALQSEPTRGELFGYVNRVLQALARPQGVRRHRGGLLRRWLGRD